MEYVFPDDGVVGCGRRAHRISEVVPRVHVREEDHTAESMVEHCEATDRRVGGVGAMSRCLVAAR